ncbi:MAG TPA: hypothetical protein PK918_08395 [Methanotrichaceae archaeon]|nr:hypothetical protein [Methanotrichaceae archaeon]
MQPDEDDLKISAARDILFSLIDSGRAIEGINESRIKIGSVVALKCMANA